MTLTVPVTNVVDALDLKAQVEQACGNNYRWRYNPQVNNWLGDEVLTPGTVVFEFVDAKWVTYFQLKFT